MTITSEELNITGQMTGGTITLDSSELVIGTGTTQQSATGGTIVFGYGTSQVDFTNLGSNPVQPVQIQGLNDYDSIGVTTPFDKETLKTSGGVTTLTLSEGNTTVAKFNVTLANGASTSFQPITTEVIGGTTYYVATLDPPPAGATGPTGPSGLSGSGSTGTTGSGGTGGGFNQVGESQSGGPVLPGGNTGSSAGPTDHHHGDHDSSPRWTVPVTSQNVLGGLEHASFLGGSGGLNPPTPVLHPTSDSHVPPAIVGFNPSELANIGGTGGLTPNNAGQGAAVTPHETGQHGSSLEQDSKPPPGLVPPHHH